MPLIARIFLYLVGGYILLCVIVYVAQRRFLYFPDRDCPGKSELEARRLRFWPDSESSFRGYCCGPDSASPNGTVIVFHGNAGAAWHRDFYCKPLVELGHRVLLAEYPGYGGRPGKPSEKILIEDARRTIRLVGEGFPGPVFVFGESLGAAVAAGAAADSSLQVKGICLITPWAGLTELAQSIYPFLPVRWLIKDRYDSIRYMERFERRTAIAVAEQDEVVTPQQGLKLFESIEGEKKLWIMEDASHNTWMFRVRPAFWKEIMNFLTQS